MKNQEYQKSQGPADGDLSDERMPEEIIGDKELYNWLYQQEEEDYYLSEKVSGVLPHFSHEALFVEY